MPTDPKARAWLEVDAEALRANLRTVRDAVRGAAGVLPMVKADGYGVGLAAAVRVLAEERPWGYGVAAVGEGRAVRDAGWSGPVVVFSTPAPGDLDEAVDAGLEIALSGEWALERIAGLAVDGAQPAFHLEVDTGMGRAGVPPHDLPETRRAIEAAVAAGARWSGVFTHLHSADEDPETVDAQMARFREALERLDPPPEVRRHVLNSAGCFVRPGYASDLVRPGIFLYGGRPGAAAPVPRPVVSLRGRVIHLRTAGPGDTVGYGATHRASADERWATVAVGYGDGYPRSLSGRGSALLRGRRVPVIGRISMDVTVVDVSGVESVKPGDVVTFLGHDGDECITVDEVAERAGTISYEILTGFTGRLPRVWTGDDRP